MDKISDSEPPTSTGRPPFDNGSAEQPRHQQLPPPRPNQRKYTTVPRDGDGGGAAPGNPRSYTSNPKSGQGAPPRNFGPPRSGGDRPGGTAAAYNNEQSQSPPQRRSYTSQTPGGRGSGGGDQPPRRSYNTNPLSPPRATTTGQRTPGAIANRASPSGAWKGGSGGGANGSDSGGNTGSVLKLVNPLRISRIDVVSALGDLDIAQRPASRRGGGGEGDRPRGGGRGSRPVASASGDAGTYGA
jgi:hypothetical protein